MTRSARSMACAPARWGCYGKTWSTCAACLAKRWRTCAAPRRRRWARRAWTSARTTWNESCAPSRRARSGTSSTLEATALRLHRLAADLRYDLRAIAIPKTIDNDLVEIDHCPGHPSVARWLGVSVREAGLDTEAIGTADPVKVVETMGRHTGWVAASTALARQREGEAPHLIYLPERPFATQQFLADVERVHRERGHVLIAAAEGLVDERGQFLEASQRSVEADPLGRPQFGGVGAVLCDLVMTHLKLKARFDKPGTMQRVSSILVSSVDAEEAYRVGQAAVREAVAGGGGTMITLVRDPGPAYRSTTGTVPLDRVVGNVRRVPEAFIAP